jgi:hypothetical protein
MIGVNPITAKNNIVVILHLDDKECGSKRLAPNGEQHGDDASSLHRVAPTSLKVRLVYINSLSSHPRFLKTEYNIKLMTSPPSMSILEIGLPSM